MSVEVIKSNEPLKIKEGNVVKITEMGNIIEVMYAEKKNSSSSIKMLKNHEYVDLRTGEVKQCKKQEVRIDDVNEIKKSLKRLRNIINTNVVDVKKCKFLTLTYAENMTDTKKLYIDFKNFMKRLKYDFKKRNFDIEYIVACEPQGRGAWHAHVILIFDKKIGYINNDVFSALWGHGFTSVKNIDNCDNVGAYLSAYLSDLEVDINNDIGDVKKCVSIDGCKSSKRFVKGGRLHMYPAKFNLYRCSRGIRKPVVEYILQKDVQKRVSSAKLTHESTVKISDELTDFNNTFNYKYYNKIRK